MNLRTTYILFCLLGGFILLFAAAMYMEPAAPSSNFVLPNAQKNIKPEDVERVEIDRKRPVEEKLVFAKDAETKKWRITEPRELRADTFAVDGLVRQLLRAERDAKADKPRNLQEWGLDPEAATVTLTAGDKTATLHVGDLSPDEAVLYVTSSDRPKEALAVRKSSLGDVLKKVVEFRDRDLLGRAESDMQSIRIVDGKKVVALKKVDDSHWTYTEPAYGSAEMEGEPTPAAAVGEKPPSGVRPLLQDLSSLRVDFKSDKDNDFVADDVPDADLAQYNLDPAKSKILRIEIEKAEGTKAEGKAPSKVTLLLGIDKAVDGKYFAHIEGEKNVVKVAAKEVDPLIKLTEDPAALRDRTLVRFDGFKTPDALDVKNGAGLLEFRREEATKPWQLYRGDSPTAVDEKAVQGLLSLLTQKNVVRTFPDPKSSPADLGLDKPAAVVSLWVDGIAKEDKKDDKKDEKKEEKKPDAKPKLKSDKPTVRLIFGKVENNLVTVQREIGDEKILVMVPSHFLERVKDGPLAYLDRALPKFNELNPALNVTKLTLMRSGVTTEITKDAKVAAPDQAWKFDKPADLAGRTADTRAVETILSTLNGLTTPKFVSDKADAEIVDKEFGLKTPNLKATITVSKGDKPTAYDYEFGKDLDMQTVYARQGQRPNLVFAAEKMALKPLSADLLDPTVVRFDPAKVKALKLTGWKDVTGTPITLQFERKDGTEWKAVKPEGFVVSSSKVNQLLAELSALRAEKFLAKKVATPKEREDNGLTPDKGSLAVEITVEGEKDPIVLHVGSLDAEKTAYLTTTNRLGDELFKVRKDVWEKAREKPAFFSP